MPGAKSENYPPHGPAFFPQGQQAAGADVPALDVPASVVTAKTLKLRVVWADPHAGQETGSVELIDRTSLSNDFSHSEQVYS